MKGKDEVLMALTNTDKYLVKIDILDTRWPQIPFSG